MKLVPYDNVVLVSPKPSAEVTAILTSLVGPRTWRFWQSDRPPFLGNVEGTSFTIRRRINYRNSFLPVLHGSIEGSPDGTTVRIKMMPHLFVIVFMTVWFSFLVVVSAAALRRGEPVFLVATAGMCVFVWLMLMGGFWFEVRAARRLLEQALCATRLK